MKRKVNELEQAVNAQERFLRAVSERLDVVIELLEKIAPQEVVAPVVEEVKPEPVVEVKIEEVKVTPQVKKKK